MNKKLILIFCALCICLAGCALRELSPKNSYLSIRSTIMKKQNKAQRRASKKRKKLLRAMEKAIERGDVDLLSKIVVDNKISDYPRKQAAKALGKIGDPRAIQPLLAAIKNTPDKRLTNIDDHTRKLFARCLGQIGQPAVDPLIATLKSPLALMRLHAVQALGHTGDFRAMEPLIVALNDSEESMRSAAAEALGHIGDKSAIEPLVSALSDEEWNVRKQAVRALQKRLGWKPSTKDEKLAVLFATEDFYSLNRMGDQGANLMIKALLTDSFFLIRKKAARVLGDTHSSEVEEALMTAAKSDDNESVREAAKSSLTKLEVYVEEEPLKTDLKVILSSPGFPSVVTPKGDIATINFKSNKSLEGKNLVLNIYFPVGYGGVKGSTRFIYKGESLVKPGRSTAGKYTMTSDKQGQIRLIIATPQVSGPPNSFGRSETFLLHGKRSIIIKLLLHEGDKELRVSNLLPVEVEFK